MGCFFACFGSLKHRQRRRSVNVNRPKDQGDEICEPLKLIESTKQETSAKPIVLLRDKLEEPLDCSPKKRVTFDLNVQICEEKTVEKSAKKPVKNNEKKEIEKKEETSEKIKSVFNPTTPNVISYPPNHRYQNCANSEDDDYEDLGSEGSDIDDVYDDIYNEDVGSDRKQIFEQQESSESLFSLSIDSRRKQVCEVELGDEKEVSSPIPVCGSKNQESEKSELNQEARDTKTNECVLKPVENLTQWKLVKARGRTPMASICQEKENLDTLQNLKQENRKVVDQGIAVDTSLSSWLVESETTPTSKSSSDVSVGNSPMKKENSVKNCEDRMIPEELRMEEVKELSVFRSPIGSRSCSSDEPVMGTVGSYWRRKRNVIDLDSRSSVSRGMPKTRNISGKDDHAKCHLTTPFEARLERTLNTSIAEV